jgi:hypothetical protein
MPSPVSGEDPILLKVSFCGEIRKSRGQSGFARRGKVVKDELPLEHLHVIIGSAGSVVTACYTQFSLSFQRMM